MPEEIQRQIEELSDKIQKLEDFNEEQKKENEKLMELIESFESHNHTGNDRTEILKSRIELAPGEQFQTGNFAIAEATLSSGGKDNVINGFLVAGKDNEGSDGIDNSQLTLQHLESTNGTTNQTFFFGFRAPLFSGTNASISSGGTTMDTDEFIFDNDELDGAYLLVYDSANAGQFEAFEIASNTPNEITITGGTWTFTDSSATWIVFVPIYLGSADYPWRRVYTGPGTEGGVRFGFGDTNGGQNGLLYMDSAGDLYWRDEVGTSTKLN